MRCLLSFFITHYAARGCHSNNGTSCGVFCIAANTTASDPYWGIGAALCVHIMLVVEELLVIIYFVVVVYVI